MKKRPRKGHTIRWFIWSNFLFQRNTVTKCKRKTERGRAMVAIIISNSLSIWTEWNNCTDRSKRNCRTRKNFATSQKWHSIKSRRISTSTSSQCPDWCNWKWSACSYTGHAENLIRSLDAFQTTTARYAKVLLNKLWGKTLFSWMCIF